MENNMKISVTLPTSSDLFKKHFQNVYGWAGAGIFHPNMESFFEDLNDICKIEDSLKQINTNET